jgi:uncharacterized membrane protein
MGAAAVPPPVSAVPPPAGSAPPYAAVAPASGLQENVAACLSYVLGWLTGIIFLLIDKRPFVRFHAAQSIVVFGALHIIRLVLAFGFLGGRGLGFFSIWSLLSTLVSLVTLVVWIVLMVTAYQGKRLEIPVAAGIAKSIAGNPGI